MHGIPEEKLKKVFEACARYGVSRLFVFGSALHDGFKPGKSDLDLLVEFEPMEDYARVDAYFGLLDELRLLLEMKIDLVMAGAVRNQYIAREIERTKESLYVA